MPASQANYEILIPRSAHDIARRAAEYVSGELGRDASISLERDREVWNDGAGEYMDVLHVLTPESPHTDSVLKQVGVYVADVTGREPIVVSKHGSGGIQVWPMRFNTQ